MKSFKAILLKECRHIYRDYKTLFFIFLMPIVLVLLFGYTIRNEINNADFAVLDNSKSVTSRQIINNLKSSDYFSLKTPHTPANLLFFLCQQSPINFIIG